MRRLYGAWFVKEDPGNSMQGATESLLLVGTHWLPPTVPSDGGFLPLKAPLRSGRLLFSRARMTVAKQSVALLSYDACSAMTAPCLRATGRCARTSAPHQGSPVRDSK